MKPRPPTSPTGSTCNSTIFRRFRRLRVTGIVYACGSICGILLFLNFNEDFTRTVQQEGRSYVASPPQESFTNSAESATEPQEPTSHRETSKPWFMWSGTRFPEPATSSEGLWAEEAPDSDRIVEQLMYVTEDGATPSPVLLSGEPSGIASGTSSKTRKLINPPAYGRDRESRKFPQQTLSDSRLSGSSSVTVRKSPAQLKTILLYYGLGMSWGPHITSGRNVFIQQKCPVNACTLTGNRAQMGEADAVLFKDVFMTPNARRSADQLWIIYMLECPLNTQNFAGKNVFNMTATYRHDSDIVTPYEKWVYYDDSVRALPQGRNYAAEKTKKVAWFVSNCVAKNNRLEYARELGKYIEVDIYGACGSHSCSRTNSKQCFDLLSKNYKFYLAFENSNCRDYISEKFFVNGLLNDVLPIVMGAHPDDYRRAAPHKSYIHVDDFASPKDLAQFLRELDEDDEAYNAYFEWKGTGEFINTHFFCRLCAMVHYASRAPKSSARVYSNFNDWWRGPNVCTKRSWRNQVDIFANKTTEDSESVTWSGQQASD